MIRWDIWLKGMLTAAITAVGAAMSTIMAAAAYLKDSPLPLPTEQLNADVTTTSPCNFCDPLCPCAESFAFVPYTIISCN